MPHFILKSPVLFFLVALTATANIGFGRLRWENVDRDFHAEGRQSLAALTEDTRSFRAEVKSTPRVLGKMWRDLRDNMKAVHDDTVLKAQLVEERFSQRQTTSESSVFYRAPAR